MSIKGRAYIAGAYEHPTRKAPDSSVAQLHAHAPPGYRADQRKSKLEVRSEPILLKCVTSLAQILYHVFPVELNEMRKQEAVMQRGSPPSELAAVRIPPEVRDQRAHQQLLGETHACVRRHLERPQLHQAKPR